MNDSNTNLEKEFFEYLDAKFGKNFSSTIQKPDGYCIGERVLYKLHQPAEVKRKNHESDEENVKNMLRGIAGENSEVSSIETRPAVTTNNIEPRLIDLPDCDIMFNIPLMKYFESDELLPHPEFKIEWLIGVYFAGSEKKLVSIDMAHPVVKGIFSVPYEMDLSADPQKTSKYFKEYIQRLKSLCKKSEKSDSNIEWVKLVQIDNDLMFKQRRKSTT